MYEYEQSKITPALQKSFLRTCNATLWDLLLRLHAHAGRTLTCVAVVSYTVCYTVSKFFYHFRFIEDFRKCNIQIVQLFCACCWVCRLSVFMSGACNTNFNEKENNCSLLYFSFILKQQLSIMVFSFYFRFIKDFRNCNIQIVQLFCPLPK